MYHVRIRKYVRILLKHTRNYSDIVLDKSVLATSPYSVTSTTHDPISVHEWAFERKEENELLLWSCIILKVLSTYASPPWLRVSLEAYMKLFHTFKQVV